MSEIKAFSIEIKGAGTKEEVLQDLKSMIHIIEARSASELSGRRSVWKVLYHRKRFGRFERLTSYD